MIIGVKYWARGASVPGSWTNLQVAECEAAEDIYEYDSGEALDGEEFGFKRNKYVIRLSIDPLAFNDGTYGTVVAALRVADFARVKDTRYSWLGDANEINFRVLGSREERDEPTLLARSVEISLRAVVKH